MVIEPSDEIEISLSAHDDLDRNLYKDVKWFKGLIIFTFIIALEFVSYAFVVVVGGYDIAHFVLDIKIWLLWTVPLSLHFFALLCLSLENLESLGMLPRARSPNRWSFFVWISLSGMTGWTASQMVIITYFSSFIFHGTTGGIYFLFCLIGAFKQQRR